MFNLFKPFEARVNDCVEGFGTATPYSSITVRNPRPAGGYQFNVPDLGDPDVNHDGRQIARGEIYYCRPYAIAWIIPSIKKSPAQIFSPAT